MIHYYNCMVIRNHDSGLLDPETSFTVISESYRDAYAKCRLIKGRHKAFSIQQDRLISDGSPLYPLKAAHL